MIEVPLLAVALSMDAFPVSVALGAKNADKPLALAFKAGLFMHTKWFLLELKSRSII